MSSFLEQLKRLPHYLFLVSDYEIFEALMAAIFIVYGLVILNPAVDTFSAGKAYNLVSQVMSEWQLGNLLISMGLFKLIALIRAVYGLRLIATSLAFVVWSLIFSAMLVSNPTASVPWFMLTFALFSAALIGRLWRDYNQDNPTWRDK